MSSTFYTVCLSHDPALLAREHRTAEEAEAAVRAGTSGHESCDQLIIRSSGAPVEIGCPGHGFPDDARPRPHWCRTRHAHTEWVDVGWLHVLVHARLAGALPESVARHHDLSCWTEQRLWRLREELGLELPQRVDYPGGDQPEVVHPEVSAQASTLPEADEKAPSVAPRGQAYPGWRQNPDGAWELPIDGGTLTASAGMSETRLAQLSLLFAGPVLRGGA